MQPFISIMLAKHIASMLLAVVALASPINWQHDPILTISAHTHDQSVIVKYLQDTFETLGATLLNYYIQRERSCVAKTIVKYYLRNLEEVSQEYEASECRTNANQKFKSVLKPSSNVHEFVHSHRNQVSWQLETILTEQFQHRENLKDYKFYQFDDLDYTMECLVGYQDLVQVKLNETAIEATLERVVEVPESCEFQLLYPDFSGQYRETETIKIPLHGNLYCCKGRSSTCTRSTAETRNAHFKLFTYK